MQLTGIGAVYEDFTWAAPITNTFGSVNTGQAFNCGPAVSELSMEKSVTLNTAVPYQSPVTYTVVLANSGALSDTAVLFTDTLPISTTFGSWIEQPVGATVTNGEINWMGTVTNGTAITFTFTANQTADYGQTITNTAEFSGTTTAGIAEAAFTVAALTGDITFVYYDLEDVVQPGEAVYLTGDFNSWSTTALSMTADAGNEVFTATVPALAAGDYDYKYIVYTDTVPAGPPQEGWLNTNNRSYTVAGTATVDDYRHVAVDEATLAPATLETDIGVATANAYGQVSVASVTDSDGEGRGLRAELGYGTALDPAAWNWSAMSFNTQSGSNDEFSGVMTPTLPGVYSYTARFDGNWGLGNPNAAWTYGDLNGLPFDLSETGVMTVNFTAVPIATARAGSNGEVFAVEGQVTYNPGTFNSAGWALQDSSGGIAAFFFPAPSLDLGDTVRLIGQRGTFSGEEQFSSSLYLENLGDGPEVAPTTYSTADIANGSSEGWLVEVSGTLLNLNPNDCNGTFEFDVDDGSGAALVYVDSDTGINLCAYESGVDVTVVGFSTEFNGTYEIKPRRPSDVQVFLDSPIVISTSPADDATGVFTDTLITIEFSEPVTVTAEWFGISCSLSGDVAGSASTGPSASYIITPTSSFANGDICVVTVLADQVSRAGGVTMAADYQFSFTVGVPSGLGACGDSATLISFVQGSGLSTPLAGTTVVVEGVVVGDYQGTGGFNGFFMQEEDGDVDSDPATSEGIFINSTTEVAAGDVVRVQGSAEEFFDLTRLSPVSGLIVCSSGSSVTPAEITLPITDLNDLEVAEGMLISMTQDLYVTEHFNLGRFGQVALSVNDRLFQPTNVITPGLDANNLQDLNNRSRILLDDGLNDQNPAAVIYPDPGLTFTNTLRAGDVVNNLVGVLDYGFGFYRIQPVGVISFTEANLRTAAPQDVGGQIQVASFNVLNYFTTIDDSGSICGPSEDMDCRGADSEEEFQRQRTKIINAILAMDVDIVGLIEIENNVNDDAVIDLVAGLNDAAGSGTYAYIDTGVIGTDAIKQALIYQPASVTPVGDYAILDGSIDARFLDTKNRPVLIQTFAENGTGELVTIAVNHLKSKGSDCEDVGDPDVGDGQGNCNVTRTEAAAALVDYLATDPTESGVSRFLIIGDLNSYAMEDPITTIKAAGYADLLAEFVGMAAYSYVFDGQFGYLDHGLASDGLLPMVTGATAWHINADEPRVFDYNTESKTVDQIAEWYGPEGYRSSDHDPVIIGLTFPTVSITSPSDGAVFTSTNDMPVSIPITITTTDFTIPDDGHWHLWVDEEMVGPVMGYTTTVDLLPGVHIISAELRTPDHVSLGIIDTVTVTVNVEYMLYLPVVVKAETATAVSDTLPVVDTGSHGWLAVVFSLPIMLVGMLPISRLRISKE